MINFIHVNSFSKKKQFLLSEFYLKEGGGGGEIFEEN